MNKKFFFSSIFVAFLILILSFNPVIVGETKENVFEYNKKNQVYRKIFENGYSKLYNILFEKDCNCLFIDSNNTIYCMILLLIIMILWLIPGLGWILIVELDLGSLYKENCYY